MKKIFFTLLFTVCVLITAQAQFDNYIRISGNLGVVANSERDKKLALGGSITWLTADNIISGNSENYITVGIKAINNPYGEGKFITSILNDKDDAFNYIMPLVGYRFTQSGIEDGLFVEPRIGVAIGQNYTGFALSPQAGYAFDNFDVSLFVDLAFGGKNNATRTKNIITPGLSIAYSFGL